MNIYIDEAGNTGCLGLNKQKNNQGINFATQPIFALGMLIIQDEKDAQEIFNKFNVFKKKFDIKEELKGNKLTTKDYNDELEYLLSNLFDSIHFKISIYDKRFYVSTLLLRTFSNNQTFYEDTLSFYVQASLLALQNNDFFEQYCSFVSNPNKESYKQYLYFLSNYNYKEIAEEQNILKKNVSELLKNDTQLDSIKGMLLFDDYSDNIFDLINLNALFEEITWIKMDNELKNKNMNFIHDNIDWIEDIIKKQASRENLNIEFRKSLENPYLQIIDYCTSIFLHLYKNTQKIFKEKKEWAPSSDWILSHFSKLQCIIGSNNIKYTIPIPDWAMSLCIKDMYSFALPKCNLVFNPLYERKQFEIQNNLLNHEYILPYIQDILRR